MVKHVKTYTLGDGSQEGISHGPVQNTMQYEAFAIFRLSRQLKRANLSMRLKPKPDVIILVIDTGNPSRDLRISNQWVVEVIMHIRI